MNQSTILFERAKKCTPGGVHSPVRAFGSVDGTPVFFDRANGSKVICADDRSYTDFCMSWGPLILGHAHPSVVDAVHRAVDKGLSFGACHKSEADLCEKILAGYSWAEQVRLVSSGTEAVMTALRLARGITKRSKVIKFDGGYHGHSDCFLVKAGSGLVTQPIASSAGVPQEIADSTLVVPFDDPEAIDQLFEQYPEDIAAIVIEPMPANNGLLVQRAEFLAHLRKRCDEHCTLLVFDEVISGFRLHYGGYGDLVGVRPDIVTLGKIIGGGMPIGAIVGNTPMMGCLSPLGPVYQAGTLSGNPVSVAAGCATLSELSNPEVYSKLEALGSLFERRISESGRNDIQLQRQGSVLWPYFSERPLPARADEIDPNIRERFASVHKSLLSDGFYLPPSAFEVMFISIAHTESDVAKLAERMLHHTNEG